MALFVLGPDPRVGASFHGLVREVLGACELPVIVIGATSQPNLLNSDLQAGFPHQVNIEVSHFGNLVKHLILIELKPMQVNRRSATVRVLVRARL